MAFIEKERQGVRYLVSTLLDCPHAFSTRLGGVSTLPHLQSMNLGENRGDDPENVKENLRRFCDACRLPPRVSLARQIHSDLVLYQREPSPVLPECDGFYTDRQGISLMVKIADCIPILLYAPDVPAVAALHAGWRGSAAGIAKKGVASLRALGADPKRIRAAIGAGICKECYRVGKELPELFVNTLGSEVFAFFKEADEQGFFADLKGINRHLLLQCGLQEELVDLCPRCSCHESALFFSHRASKGLRGTMGAAIALPF